MPLYEYRCSRCEHDFELLVRESTARECPSCGSPDLERQLSVFAVQSQNPRPIARTAATGPCGACGNPNGPGSCSVN